MDRRDRADGTRAWRSFVVILAACGGLSSLAVSLTVGAQGDPGGDLGSGPYATMSAKLERTVFDVDVVDVELQFDEPVARKIAEVAHGKEYSAERADRVAAIAVQAERARARVVFLRDVGLDRFLESVKDDVREAQEAGMIDVETRRAISESLPQWFAFLEQRGFHEGDRLYYEIRPGFVRTTLVNRRGTVIGERLVEGSEYARSVLASYLAPGTTLRDQLLRSVF